MHDKRRKNIEEGVLIDMLYDSRLENHVIIVSDNKLITQEIPEFGSITVKSKDGKAVFLESQVQNKI